MVTVLSCVVLGTLWGFVVYLLPDSTSMSQPAPRTVPSPTTPSPSAPTAQTFGEPTSPAPVPPPILVKETPALDQTSMPARSPAQVTPLPFVMDVKCAMEIDSLCPEDDGDRRLCWEDKATQLSKPCRPILRERLGRMKEHLQQMRVACEADRQQYCRDESLSGSAIVQCLGSHAQEVSDQCFQYLPKRGRLLN
jgi:hypothetical protein